MYLYIISVAFLSHDYKPRIWIRTFNPDGSGSGKCYNDLIKISENQYLFVGKDGFGKTFDSTIITINK